MDLQNAYKFGVKDDFLRDYISWKVFQGNFERTRRSSGIGKMRNNSILSYCIFPYLYLGISALVVAEMGG